MLGLLCEMGTFIGPEVSPRVAKAFPLMMPPEVPLFYQDYKDKQDYEFWTRRLGTWGVEDGELSGDVGGVAALRYALVNALGLDLKAYRLKVKFVYRTDYTGARCFIHFNAVDVNNYYEAHFVLGVDQMGIDKIFGGVWSWNIGGPPSIVPQALDTWLDVELIARGNGNFDLYANGVLYTATDTDLPSGNIAYGLETSHCHFDELIIYR